MFSTLSNISLSVRRQTWITNISPLFLLLRTTYSSSQVSSQDPIKAARNAVRRARRRHRIATDPDFREREALANHKSWQKCRDIHSSKLKAQYRADTATYRPRKLHSFIWWWHKSGRLNEWSWRTHQLVIFPDRAAHECTACKRDRSLI